MIMITSQARAQTRSTASVVRSGWTSSSQLKANRARAAGQTPSRRRQLEQTLPRIDRASAAEPAVQRPQRIGRPPERAQQQRDRHQSDPHPHVDEAEDRVGQQILAEHQRQRRPGVHREHQQSGGSADRRVIDDPGQTGERTTAGPCGTSASARRRSTPRRTAPGRRPRRARRRRTAAAGRAGRRSRAAGSAATSPACGRQRTFKITITLLEMMRLDLEAARAGRR